jgi:hypothetical protein
MTDPVTRNAIVMSPASMMWHQSALVQGSRRFLYSSSSLNWNPTTDTTPVLHDVRRTLLLHYCPPSGHTRHPVSQCSVLLPHVTKFLRITTRYIFVLNHFTAWSRMSTSTIPHNWQALSRRLTNVSESASKVFLSLSDTCLVLFIRP